MQERSCPSKPYLSLIQTNLPKNLRHYLSNHRRNIFWIYNGKGEGRGTNEEGCEQLDRKRHMEGRGKYEDWKDEVDMINTRRGGG